MSPYAGVLLGAGIAIVAGLVWLLRLEGRVNTAEVLHAQHRVDLERRLTEMTVELRVIRALLSEVTARSSSLEPRR